jgi:hypothetical protein
MMNPLICAPERRLATGDPKLLLDSSTHAAPGRTDISLAVQGIEVSAFVLTPRNMLDVQGQLIPSPFVDAHFTWTPRATACPRQPERLAGIALWGELASPRRRGLIARRHHCTKPWPKACWRFKPVDVRPRRQWKEVKRQVALIWTVTGRRRAARPWPGIAPNMDNPNVRRAAVGGTCIERTMGRRRPAREAAHWPPSAAQGGHDRDQTRPPVPAMLNALVSRRDLFASRNNTGEAAHEKRQ